MKKLYYTAIQISVLALGLTRAGATAYLSNLSETWPEPGSIGDIQAVLPNQGFGVGFLTGPSSYRLDSVTLEHISYPFQTFRVEIYTLGPPGSTTGPGWPFIPVAPLVNPVLDPRPTQWPGSTFLVDYTPLRSVILAPNTFYMIAGLEPAIGSNETGLLFVPSSNYQMAGGWTMGGPLPPTQWALDGSNHWLQGFGSGYSLKMEINATVVPEPSSLALATIGCAWLIGQRARGKFQS